MFSPKPDWKVLYKCLCSEPYDSFLPERWPLFQFREAVFLDFPGPGEVGNSNQNESWGFPELLSVFLFCGTQAFRHISLSTLDGRLLAFCCVVEMRGLLKFHVSFMVRKRKLSAVNLPLETIY